MTEDSKTTMGATTTPATQAEFRTTKTQVRKGTDDLASAAGAMAEEYRGKAEQVWADARQRSRTLQKDSEKYVRENPTKAIMTALGIGLVLGLSFFRR